MQNGGKPLRNFNFCENYNRARVRGYYVSVYNIYGGRFWSESETASERGLQCLNMSRGGWTAPRKASWEIRARFLIHARTVAKRTSLWHKEIYITPH